MESRPSLDPLQVPTHKSIGIAKKAGVERGGGGRVDASVRSTDSYACGRQWHFVPAVFLTLSGRETLDDGYKGDRGKVERFLLRTQNLSCDVEDVRVLFFTFCVVLFLFFFLSRLEGKSQLEFASAGPGRAGPVRPWSIVHSVAQE